MTTTAKIPPITMSKLYVGNLPTETSESALRQLFLEQNLSCTSILVKRGGYAFVDCPDQSSADRAIDKLNGFNFNGSPLVVEPSVASGKKKTHPGYPDTPPMQVGNGWILFILQALKPANEIRLYAAGQSAPAPSIR